MNIDAKNRSIHVLLPIFWPNLPPIGLASLKSHLIINKIDADVIDFNNYFYNLAGDELKKQWGLSCNRRLEDNTINILAEKHPKQYENMLSELLEYDIVGFSCYKSNYKTVQYVSKLLKKRNPKQKIILGGPEVTRQYFKHYPQRMSQSKDKAFYELVDYIVIGEGEKPLIDYLKGRHGGAQFAEFIEIEDSGDLHMPDYDCFDLARYPKKNSIPLMFSRGCIRKCSFCSEKLLYKGYRVYPIERIIGFIGKYKSKGIKQFIFNDSLINGNLKALELLCDRIIQDFGSINWEAQVTVRKDMPDPLLKKMKQSGCYHLFIGIESGSGVTLKRMNKGFNLEDAVGFFKKLKEADLSFGVSIITGYPKETYQDHLDSMNFIISNRNIIPKVEQVNPYVYYEGTELTKAADYKENKESLARADMFIKKIKQAGIKHTSAFMLNLIEK